MGDPAVSGERTSGALAGLPTSGEASRSFAALVAALNRLNTLESALATAIARARVPAYEVRQVLRAQTPAQAENVPAFQFMREVFAQVGVPLAVEAVEPFQLTFAVDRSPFTGPFAPDGPRRACRFISGALARFLAEDLGVPARVEETACRSGGDDRCAFTAELDPVAVARCGLDATDRRLLDALAAGRSPRAAAGALAIQGEELAFRMEALTQYGLVAADGRMLPAGEALRAAPPTEAEDPAEPPWRSVSRLTDAIADAASAAEALVRVVPPAPASEAGPDAEVSALAAECHSFAELLARASKGRSWE